MFELISYLFLTKKRKEAVMKAYSLTSGHAIATIICFYFVDLYSVVWSKYKKLTVIH